MVTMFHDGRLCTDLRRLCRCRRSPACIGSETSWSRCSNWRRRDTDSDPDDTASLRTNNGNNNNDNNKNQNNLAISGIASFLFARWQQQFAIACFRWEGGGVGPNLAFSRGSATPSNTVCHWTPQVCLLNGT